MAVVKELISLGAATITGKTRSSSFEGAGLLSDTTSDRSTTKLWNTNGGYTNLNLQSLIGSSSIGSVAVPIYWTGSVFATVQATFGNATSGTHDANSMTSNGLWYYSSNGPSTTTIANNGNGASTGDGALYSQAYSSSWVGLIAQDYRNGWLFVRGRNNGSWTSWLTILNSANFSSYVTSTYINNNLTKKYWANIELTTTQQTDRIPTLGGLFIGSSSGSGYNAVAEGYSVANGDYAHSEGSGSYASGLYSHAEGEDTVAGYDALSAHAEGHATHAVGIYSHAEGDSTYAYYQACHAEGWGTKAGYDPDYGYGSYAHAEGVSTVACGNYSHAEGNQTHATANQAHAEGWGTWATNNGAHAEGDETTASGRYCHAEGESTTANGNYSHAEGHLSKAYGVAAHAEGYNSQTGGNDTSNTLTVGTDSSNGAYAHAEGNATLAQGNSSHSEGYKTFAKGKYSHAEGLATQATGTSTHAEGYNTKAIGEASHAEGISDPDIYRTNVLYNFRGSGRFTTPGNGIAIGDILHVFPLNGGDELVFDTIGGVTETYISVPPNKIYSTLTDNTYYNIKIQKNSGAHGTASHVEGKNTVGNGYYSHAEGHLSKAYGVAAHTEGEDTIAIGDESHAEGYNTFAYGSESHAEGGGLSSTITITGAANATSYTVSSGASNCKVGAIVKYGNVAKLITNKSESTITLNATLSSSALSAVNARLQTNGMAIGEYAHSEGEDCIANGEAAHAEGRNTLASGVNSHSEGYNTIASAEGSHAEGEDTQALGEYSHTGGLGTYAGSESQTVIGEYNTKDTTGTSTSRGTYAFIIGNGTSDSARSNAFAVKWNGDVYAGTNGNKKLATEEYVGTTSISQAQHYMPELTDSTIPLITEGTDTTTVSGESIEYVNYARELNIDAKKHLISAEYERYDFPAEPKTSHNFIVSWLVMNLSEERLVSNGPVYNGKIAIPLFCPRSALKGYMTQRYWLWGKNNFRQCDMFIQNYILDSPTLISNVNDNLFWSSFGISGFGNFNAYQYLQSRFGIGGHSANIDYSACSQYRTFTIDMRNHWTVFDSDYYWERNPVSRNVKIHHSALYHCGGALSYNNDVTIQSTDICYNTLQLSFTNERVREDFLGGRRYNGFYLGDEEFYDFGFMIFQTGIAPNTNDYAGGWDGTDFVNYTNQYWKKIYDSLKEISHDSTVLSEISNSPYFAEQ